MAKDNELRFQQLVAAPWKDTYSVIGLTTSGVAYRYERARGGWIRLAMQKVDDEQRDQE